MQEQPRGIFFHWAANMVFAGIALFGGILFGMEVPKDRVVPIIVLGALALIPFTRRWERNAMNNRRAQAAGEQQDKLPNDLDSSS